MRNSDPAPESSSELRPARRIAIILVLLTVTGLCALAVSGLSTLIKIILAPTVIFYGLRSAWSLIRPSVRRLAWDGEFLILENPEGSRSRYRRRGQAFVSPVFIGLVLDADSGIGRRLGLFRSQVDAEFWRQSMIRVQARAVDRAA